MRKKTLLALLAMILTGASALLLFELHKSPAWPLASVDATFRKTVAADPKIRTTAMEYIPGEIQGNRHPLLNSLSHALRHRSLYRDISKYHLHTGSDEVWVIIHHANNLVDSVEIEPNSPASKLGECLHAALAAAHPGLRCFIKKT